MCPLHGVTPCGQTEINVAITCFMPEKAANDNYGKPAVAEVTVHEVRGRQCELTEAYACNVFGLKLFENIFYCHTTH